MKFVVGLLVSAFGLFWFGEGIGVAWPYSDAAFGALFAGLLALSHVAVYLVGEELAVRCESVG